MKSPREILLARHEAADAKLEALSEQVIAESPARTGRESSPPFSWVEWLWPGRLAWSAIAAAWLVIAFLHLSAPDIDTGGSKPGHSLALSRETKAALMAQQRLMSELVEPAHTEPADRRPRSAVKPTAQNA